MKKEDIKILVACEESQVVCREFRNIGIGAYSCDILQTSGDHPEWHIQGDVLNILHGGCTFYTMDGLAHEVLGRWTAVIAFPPCTDLAVSGAAWFAKKRDSGEQLRSIQFFADFIECPCDYVAIENPVGIIGGKYLQKYFPEYSWMPSYTQIIEPYYFGDNANKKTCLWLKGLPALKHDPKDYVEGSKYFTAPSGRRYPDWCQKTGGGCGVKRSKTFPGIGRAMAEQWSNFLLSM